MNESIPIAGVTTTKAPHVSAIRVQAGLALGTGA